MPSVHHLAVSMLIVSLDLSYNSNIFLWKNAFVKNAFHCCASNYMTYGPMMQLKDLEKANKWTLSLLYFITVMITVADVATWNLQFPLLSLSEIQHTVLYIVTHTLFISVVSFPSLILKRIRHERKMYYKSHQEKMYILIEFLLRQDVLIWVQYIREKGLRLCLNLREWFMILWGQTASERTDTDLEV